MPETRLTYEIPDDDEGNENNLLNELEDAEELDEQIKQSKHHTKFKSIQGNAAKYLDELEHRTIEHNRLRPTQVMAAMGFTEWIKNGIHQDRLMGHIVQPPGAGKTTIAIMLSEMAQGRTVVIGYNKPANLIRDFRKHEQSKELGQQRAIGQCFGGTSDITQPVTVAHFESFKKKLDSFNWSDVNLIIVDEADINALSPDRAAILTELAENYGIPVIGMSATEEQASGKKLQDVFPDEVTRLGMPDSLPLCLKMGIAPAMSFSDLYLELTMELDGDELKTKKDLPSEEIESFIHSTEWISLILDHYTEQFQKEGRFSTGMIVFRDNGSVETCLKEAQKRGIKAASLTGDLNDRLRRSRQEALAKGDLDLLVGSQLIGRGLHIPQVEVVYNSTITWSPQLFWQADGRAASINPDDLAKKSHIFAVLPKAMKDRRTGELLRKEQRPLCHAAFFNPAYYEDLQDRLVLLHEEKGRAIYQDLQGGTDNEKSGDFELGKLTTIRTIGEVTKITKRLREKPIDFKSRSRIIAEYLDALNEIDMRPGFIRRLLRSHTHEIKTNTDRLVGTTAHYEWTLAELRRIGGISPTPKSTEVPQSMLRKLASNAPILSRTEEVELLMEAHAENNVAIQILIESHLPLILSMTRHFKSDCIDENDLAQVAIEELIKVIRQKRISTGLSGYVLMSSYHAMSRYVAETERDVRIGLGPREKVRKVLQVRETQSLTIRSLYDGNVSLSAISDEEVHEELGITQEDYYKIIMGNLDHQLRILELHNRLKHFLKLAESYIPMELPDIYLRLKGQKSGKNKAGVRYEMMGLDELCSAIEVDPMELERLLYMDRKLLRSELSKHSDIADSLPFSTLYISDTEKIGKFYRRKNIRASVTEDLFYSIRTDNQSDMNIYLKAIEYLGKEHKMLNIPIDHRYTMHLARTFGKSAFSTRIKSPEIFADKDQLAELKRRVEWESKKGAEEALNAVLEMSPNTEELYAAVNLSFEEEKEIEKLIAARNRLEKTERVRRGLAQEYNHGERPTFIQVARTLGLSGGHQEEIKAMLDAGETHFDESEHAAIQPIPAFVRQQDRTAIHNALQMLAARERRIIRESFGFKDDKEKMLKGIGKKFNLSGERIRQLKELALRHLRATLDPSIMEDTTL